MDKLTDQQLMRKSAMGDQVALEALVKRYLKLVYRFAYGYVRNREDAEDITQEVFVKVWRNLSSFDQSKTFKPWLYQITKHAALDALKKKTALPFSSFAAADGSNWLVETLADESQQPQDAVEQALVAGKLAFAVQQLAPQYAEVVELRHAQQLNFREIAEATGEPLNTVKSRYRRALGLLKKILGT